MYIPQNNKIQQNMKRDKKLQTTTDTTIGYDPLLAVVDVKYSKVPSICFSF